MDETGLTFPNIKRPYLQHAAHPFETVLEPIMLPETAPETAIPKMPIQLLQTVSYTHPHHNPYIIHLRVLYRFIVGT